jgi:thioredoxin reductase (NADPH)
MQERGQRRVRDLLVIGAGACGLATAVEGAYDKLDTLLVEAATRPGGQFKFTSRIEDFGGFPGGVSGKTLANDMYAQAIRLGAEAKLGLSATGISYDPETGLKVVTLSDSEKVKTRTVVIATGLQFRKMVFPGSDSPDIHYGDEETITKEGKHKDVVIIGHSNGAAQAARGAARAAKHVYLLSRYPITDRFDAQPRMRGSLVHSLRITPTITVIEDDAIEKLNTDANCRAVSLLTQNRKELPCDILGVFVGLAPTSDWLPQEIQRVASGPEQGKIVVDASLETTMSGVFAAGEIRQGGPDQIQSAGGDGVRSVQSVFAYLHRDY